MFVRCYIDINCCCCNFNKTEQTERSLETENDCKYKYFNVRSPHAAKLKTFKLKDLDLQLIKESLCILKNVNNLFSI